MLNKKILALSLLLVLTIVCIASVSNVKAQTNTTTGQWITQYTIADANTHSVILQKDQTGTITSSGYISEGAELEVTATINIAVNNPSSDLTLGTSMQHSGLQGNYYWEAQSTNYSLGTFDPNQRSFSFPQTQGTLVISCFGQIPTGKVEQPGPNGITLHIPTPFNLVTLSDPSGSVLDQVSVNITDSVINQYQVLLNTKEASLKNLQSSGVDPGFISIYQSVITASQAMEGQGFADAAITMLNGLNVTSPPSAGTQALFLPVAGVLAALAAVFAFLFFRVRGKVSYFQLVVEDQIKDLEGLTLRVSKIDRTVSSNLESVKDRLKRLVGM